LDIAIRYSVERGFEEAALIFARRLFAEYDEAIDSLALIPDADDDLAVYLDGRLVHSASRSGRLPRLADVRAAQERVPRSPG
jgi:hypothetical protein